MYFFKNNMYIIYPSISTFLSSDDFTVIKSYLTALIFVAVVVVVIFPSIWKTNVEELYQVGIIQKSSMKEYFWLN